MTKINNWIMDIEYFCNRYFYGGDMNNNFSHDEIVEDVNEYFKSKDAGKYARHYLIRQLKEE